MFKLFRKKIDYMALLKEMPDPWLLKRSYDGVWGCEPYRLDAREKLMIGNTPEEAILKAYKQWQASKEII